MKVEKNGLNGLVFETTSANRQGAVILAAITVKCFGQNPYLNLSKVLIEVFHI